jgi:hypothetical protein
VRKCRDVRFDIHAVQHFKKCAATRFRNQAFGFRLGDGVSDFQPPRYGYEDSLSLCRVQNLAGVGEFLRFAIAKKNQREVTELSSTKLTRGPLRSAL